MKIARINFAYLYREGDLIPLPTKENRYRSQNRKKDLQAKRRRLGPVASSLKKTSLIEKEFNDLHRKTDCESKDEI